MFGVWCLVFGVWCLMCLVFDVRCSVFGVWRQVFGVRCLGFVFQGGWGEVGGSGFGGWGGGGVAPDREIFIENQLVRMNSLSR